MLTILPRAWDGHDVSCPYGNAGNDRIVAVTGMAMGNVAALTAMLTILNL